MNRDWICTDSDCSQYVRQLHVDLQEFGYRIWQTVMQVKINDQYAPVFQLIDIENYNIMSNSFVETYLLPYGYHSVNEIQKEYGDYRDQILAEIIAKTDALEHITNITFQSWKECDEFIRETYINNKQ